MPFEDDLARHADQIKSRTAYVRGEEATKQALVVPLLQVLGYDVFDPREVQPEFGAEMGKRKGGPSEKVDYAIHLNGVPVIFIECKAADADVGQHSGQLARYFNANPSVRVGILTNGVRLKVYTDLQSENMMDEKPWLDVDLRAPKAAEVEALKKFRKADFSSEQIVSLAEMVYFARLLEFVGQQLREPGEDFVRLAAKEIPTIGIVNRRVVERITPILKKAIHAVIVEQLSRAFSQPPEPEAVPAVVPATASQAAAEAREGIVTTAEELEAYALVEAMIKERYPAGAIGYRDARTYFTIMQRGPKSWFMRLGVERQPYWVTLRHIKPEAARPLCPGFEVTDGGQFGDSRIVIRTISDVTKLRPAILAAYDAETARVAAGADVEVSEADGALN
jgi:predicted type IV restriction endonuclease